METPIASEPRSQLFELVKIGKSHFLLNLFKKLCRFFRESFLVQISFAVNVFVVRTMFIYHVFQHPRQPVNFIRGRTALDYAFNLINEYEWILCCLILYHFIRCVRWESVEHKSRHG